MERDRDRENVSEIRNVHFASLVWRERAWDINKAAKENIGLALKHANMSHHIRPRADAFPVLHYLFLSNRLSQFYLARPLFPSCHSHKHLSLQASKTREAPMSREAHFRCVTIA